MKDKIIALFACLVLTTFAPAADFRDFVEFEKAKLTTYAEAEAKHKKTGQPVIVWLNIESFEQWHKLKNDGIHCFPTPKEVQTFAGRDFVSSGVIVAKTVDGIFARVGQVEILDKSKDIQAHLKSVQTSSGCKCAPGTCTCPAGSCASGQCLKSYTPKALRRVCVNGTCYFVED